MFNTDSKPPDWIKYDHVGPAEYEVPIGGQPGLCESTVCHVKTFNYVRGDLYAEVLVKTRESRNEINYYRGQLTSMEIQKEDLATQNIELERRIIILLALVEKLGRSNV